MGFSNTFGTNFGLQVGANGGVTASTASYGLLAGSAVTGVPAGQFTYTLTTDSTKSGVICAKDSNKYLEFYIN